MPYPESPFEENFNTDLFTTSCLGSMQKGINERQIKLVLNWLCSTPQLTTYKVNTLKTTKEEVLELIQQELCKLYGPEMTYRVEFSKICKDVVIVHNPKIVKPIIDRHSIEVTVDKTCGEAVLRGAHVFAPGVVGMFHGTQLNEKVSVYADVMRRCLRGFAEKFNCERRVFLGNGIVRMTRNDLFKVTHPRGIAIEMTEIVSGCPTLGTSFLPAGSAVLQNLPSIIAVETLNPQKGELILDMCAAPGNKTVYIAQMINNEGTIIAIDRSANRVAKLRKTCQDFGANVKIFQADSVHICSEDADDELISPFRPNTFDRILLDAPCSGTGQRPQLKSELDVQSLDAHMTLQLRLISTAIRLLKPGGVMVYSTCSVTIKENEQVIVEMLKKFSNMKILPVEHSYGGPGWHNNMIAEEETLGLQRFGPGQNNVDSVGFFIARLGKKLEI